MAIKTLLLKYLKLEAFVLALCLLGYISSGKRTISNYNKKTTSSEKPTLNYTEKDKAEITALRRDMLDWAECSNRPQEKQ